MTTRWNENEECLLIACKRRNSAFPRVMAMWDSIGLCFGLVLHTYLHMSEVFAVCRI